PAARQGNFPILINQGLDIIPLDLSMKLFFRRLLVYSAAAFPFPSGHGSPDRPAKNGSPLPPPAHLDIHLHL
ncbi:hypothetical protein P4K96_18810, partial [Bacillus cereus]|nr:hypothetical protein [Bacillus cereus]